MTFNIRVGKVLLIMALLQSCQWDTIEAPIEPSECTDHLVIGELDLFPNSKTFIHFIDSVTSIVYIHNGEDVLFNKRNIGNNTLRGLVCDSINCVSGTDTSLICYSSESILHGFLTIGYDNLRILYWTRVLSIKYPNPSENLFYDSFEIYLYNGYDVAGGTVVESSRAIMRYIINSRGNIIDTTTIKPTNMFYNTLEINSVLYFNVFETELPSGIGHIYSNTEYGLIQYDNGAGDVLNFKEFKF